MTDEHWIKVIEALGLLAHDQGLDTSQAMVLLQAYRDNWDMLHDEKQVDAYIADGNLLAQLEADKAAKEAELAALQIEIDNLS